MPHLTLATPPATACGVSTWNVITVRDIATLDRLIPLTAWCRDCVLKVEANLVDQSILWQASGAMCTREAPSSWPC